MSERLFVDPRGVSGPFLPALRIPPGQEVTCTLVGVAAQYVSEEGKVPREPGDGDRWYDVTEEVIVKGPQGGLRILYLEGLLRVAFYRSASHAYWVALGFYPSPGDVVTIKRAAQERGGWDGVFRAAGSDRGKA